MKSPLSHGLPQELQLIPCSQYLNLHLRQSCVASLLPYIFHSHWRTFQLCLSSLITDLCCVHCGLLFVHIGISHAGDIILAVSLCHVRVCFEKDETIPFVLVKPAFPPHLSSLGGLISDPPLQCRTNKRHPLPGLHC